MSSSAPLEAEDARAWELPERMGLASEIDQLKEFLSSWVEGCDPELREMVRYQLSSRSKLFRPVTIFACQRATGGGTPGDLIPAAAATELFHNYATVTDDIVDRDKIRRGKASLHHEFGQLGAQMTGAYLVFAAHGFIAHDPYALELFVDLGKRIAAVECRQWRLRRHPLGVDTWREIAGEDTGAMFAACARVATRDDRLDRYGYLLGTLYHGCDDIADIRGSLALGAHSDRDISDRILTLVAALACRDPAVARLFAETGPERDDELARALAGALPAAEAALDELAEEALGEARRNAADPRPLEQLVRFTRELSGA
jgi:geranylgeranyl pyrophosphate synthase